jgi:hypothetical protein
MQADILSFITHSDEEAWHASIIEHIGSCCFVDGEMGFIERYSSINQA